MTLFIYILQITGSVRTKC